MALKDVIAEKLRSSKDYVALATIKARDCQTTNIEIITYLTEEEKVPGVYVALNKPFSYMESKLKESGVNTDAIVFIDAVTKTAGGNVEKTPKCLFIGSPENLSDISMAMDQAVQAISGEQKFLFFDSLDTLLLYNKPATVAQFIHFLSGKMRVWKVKGIIVSLSKESNKELIDNLMQFCDIIMEL